MKKRGLGRGLGELLSSNQAPAVSTTPPEAQTDPIAIDNGAPLPQGLRRIPIDYIERGKYQPRRSFDQDALQELADSIRAQGIIQPIVVRSIGENHYEIVAGERRWRAAQLAGLDEIPTVVQDIDDQTALALGIIENIQREQLNPIEEAMGLQRLIDEFSLTQLEAAQAVGKSRVAVSNLLRLLNLHKDVITLIENGDMEMGHAKVILGLKNKSEQLEAARIVVERNLNVRDTESLVKSMLAETDPNAKSKSSRTPDPDIVRLEQSLSESLGAKVAISHKPSGKGKLVIQYHNLEQLEGILDHMRD